MDDRLTMDRQGQDPAGRHRFPLLDDACGPLAGENQAMHFRQCLPAHQERRQTDDSDAVASHPDSQEQSLVEQAFCQGEAQGLADGRRHSAERLAGQLEQLSDQIAGHIAAGRKLADEARQAILQLAQAVCRRILVLDEAPRIDLPSDIDEALEHVASRIARQAGSQWCRLLDDVQVLKGCGETAVDRACDKLDQDLRLLCDDAHMP